MEQQERRQRHASDHSQQQERSDTFIWEESRRKETQNIEP